MTRQERGKEHTHTLTSVRLYAVMSMRITRIVSLWPSLLFCPFAHSRSLLTFAHQRQLCFFVLISKALPLLLPHPRTQAQSSSSCPFVSFTLVFCVRTQFIIPSSFLSLSCNSAVASLTLLSIGSEMRERESQSKSSNDFWLLLLPQKKIADHLSLTHSA